MPNLNAAATENTYKPVQAMDGPPDLDVFSLPVHPAANAFPMLPEDELEELTTSIAANGLREPLSIACIDGQWTLIDGRNRCEACRQAGITPSYQVVDKDPLTYLFSKNVLRRHMTQGQRAMVEARMRLDLELNQDSTTRGRIKPQRVVEKETGINQARIAQANTVLRFAPELADGIVDGSVKLDAAYKAAIDRKQSLDGRNRDLERLKRKAPDLAARVGGEEITLEEARQLYDSRIEQEREIRRTTLSKLRNTVMGITGLVFNHEEYERLLEWLQDHEGYHDFRAIVCENDEDGLIDRLGYLQDGIDRLEKLVQSLMPILHQHAAKSHGKKFKHEATD